MKKILFIISIFCSLYAIGQSESSIGIETTPLYSYRLFRSNNNGNIHNKYKTLDDSQIKNLLDSIEYPIFNYSIGFKYNLKTNKFIISTGLYFLNVGEVETRFYPTDHKEYANGPMYIIVYDGEKEFDFRYIYRYLNFPLKLSYLLLDKNWKISIGLGVNANLLVSQKTKKPDNMNILMFEPSLKDSYSDTNKFLVGLSGEVSISKEINQNLSVFVAPELYLQLTPSLTIENELKQYNYYYGLSIGILRKINTGANTRLAKTGRAVQPGQSERLK